MTADGFRMVHTGGVTISGQGLHLCHNQLYVEHSIGAECSSKRLVQQQEVSVVQLLPAFNSAYCQHDAGLHTCACMYKGSGLGAYVTVIHALPNAELTYMHCNAVIPRDLRDNSALLILAEELLGLEEVGER